LVFTEWLRLDDLGYLDTATCEKRFRPDLLEVLGSGLLVYEHFGSLRGYYNNTLIDSHETFAANVLRWLALRCVHVRELNCGYGIFHHGKASAFDRLVAAGCLDRIAVLDMINEDVSKATDSFLAKLLPRCYRSLQMIDLSGCEDIEDAATVALLSQCTGLVDFTPNEWLVEFLPEIIVQKGSLRVLDVSWTGKLVMGSLLTDAIVQAVAENSPELREIRMYACFDEDSITGASLRSLSRHCPRLESIIATNCNRISLSEHHVLSFPCLKVVDLGENAFTTADTMLCVARASPLLETIIFRAVFSDAAVSALCRLCPRVQRLDLSLVRDSVDHETAVLTDASLDTIANLLPGVTHLRLTGAEGAISDDAVDRLAMSCRNLTELALKECDQLTSGSLYTLAAHCPQLTELNVSHSPLTHRDGFEELAINCPKLKKVVCSALANAAVMGILKQRFPEVAWLARELD
jgi:hypothetical protein